jgi:shikimate dehydrogenase
MKLALIGKHISHSHSPLVYKKLLGEALSSYELLDYDLEERIPLARDLLTVFDGISVTSPYKKHFLPEVELVDCPADLVGINCLRFLNNRIEATNTDFLAIEALLSGPSNIIADKEVIILGDGVMSQITQLVCRKLNIIYKLYSRRTTQNFYQLSFGNCFVINTCSRDYEFRGEVLTGVIFWDYNYNFIPHQKTLAKKCEQYIDGSSLLELQAKYAIKFWSKITP